MKFFPNDSIYLKKVNIINDVWNNNSVELLQWKIVHSFFVLMIEIEIILCHLTFLASLQLLSCLPTCLWNRSCTCQPPEQKFWDMHFYQKDNHFDLLLIDIPLWRKQNLIYGQYLVIFIAIYPYVSVKNIQNVRIFQIFRRNNFLRHRLDSS